MKKYVLAALIGATILTPATAIAQDRGGRDGRSSENRQPRQPQAQRQQGPQAQRQQPQASPQMGQQRQMGQRPDAPRNYDQRGVAPRPDGQRAITQRPDRQWQRPDARSADSSRTVQGRQWQQQQSGTAYRGDAGRAGARPDDRRTDYRSDNRRPDFRGDNRRPEYRGDNRRPDYRNDQRRFGDWRDQPQYRRGWDDNRNWNRGWRSDSRYNWNHYRQTNRNIFRLPRYYAPAGYHYGYQRFSIGLTLGAMLFAPDYWISDPFYYRLPPAYGGYRWVRYYNDALLVDIRTGYVVDAIYDIFW